MNLTGKRTKKHAGFDWGFRPLGNRVFYCLVAGVVINLAAGSAVLGAVIAIVLFVLTSVIAMTGRRN